MSRLRTDNLLAAGSLWGLIEKRAAATPDALRLSMLSFHVGWPLR